MQIIPANPTFSTLLGQALGQLPSQILQGYQQAGAQQQQAKGLESLLQTFLPDASPDQIQSISQSGLTAKDVLSNIDKLRRPETVGGVDLEKRARAETLLGTLQDMRDLISYTGSTKIPFSKSFNATTGGLNREGLQKRNTFDTLAADIASFFRDLEAKGQLPQGLYEKLIEPRLPNSKLSERENIGRIEGAEKLARRFGGFDSKDTKKADIPSKEKKESLDSIWR